MNLLPVAWTAGGLVAGAWLLFGLRPLHPLPKPKLARLGVHPTRQRANFGRGGVSVVIPARDEARTLPALLGSLAALDPRPHEVIVVDDHSSDATAEVAVRFGATVVAAPPLPDGWLGKSWAAHVGAGAATGDLLLFLDADTWLSADALDHLAAAGPDGLLSVQPHHVTERAYEQASAFPNLVSMMGSGAFVAWPHTRRSAAFGPCLLTSRTDYERAGGHAAVRGEVVEDLHLARAYRAAGLPVRCRAGGETVRFRMYPGGVRQLVEGWTKNLAAGAAGASPVAVAGAVWWVAACCAVAVTGIAAGGAWIAGSGTVPLAPAVAWAVVALQVHWLLGRIGRFRAWTSVVFVLPLLAFVALFAVSLVRTVLHRPTSWRGRRIDVGVR